MTESILVVNSCHGNINLGKQSLVTSVCLQTPRVILHKMTEIVADLLAGGKPAINTSRREFY